MAYFSYKIEHDLGLAPNPFGPYCTLAVCKPSIRDNKNLKIGDWIIGTGSVKLNNLHHLIYAMQLEEKVSFDEYWNDERFQYKKPIINGSLSQLYGDNIYHKNEKTGEWIQENSAHSFNNGSPNPGHVVPDTAGKYVLISSNFYYFGDNAKFIPKRFWNICNEGRNMKGPSISTVIGDRFIKWLEENFKKGINGDPINWNNHK